MTEPLVEKEKIRRRWKVIEILETIYRTKFLRTKTKGDIPVGISAEALRRFNTFGLKRVENGPHPWALAARRACWPSVNMSSRSRPGGRRTSIGPMEVDRETTIIASMVKPVVF